jgi:quercetin dioxygenase-like cupin family protein
VKIIRTNEKNLAHSKDKLFTDEVVRGALVSAQDSNDFIMGFVDFPIGVRNKFHTHSSDQILIITEGEGIVATKEEEWVVSAGDIVIIPADLIHWHGANSESSMSHIAIVTTGAMTNQLEE